MLHTIDTGLTDYPQMLARQRELFSEMVERKKHGLPIDNEYIFFTEHRPVVTLGRHAESANVLIPEEVLKGNGIDVFRIERGGDVTYHGPGQLVVYPLIDLEKYHLGVKDYVNMLEECVIRTIAHFGVKGERVKGASGVWIGAGSNAERKICALGVKCSRYITMHGLALNVNTDLDGFRIINPCGFTDKGVTSLAKECGRQIDMSIVTNILKDFFITLLKEHQQPTK